MPDAAVNIEAIEAAARRIAPWVHRTPLLASGLVDTALGVPVRVKAEHLQKAGAFKARGAHNAVMQLDDAQLERGVATHSSGNHAAALALAARNAGTRAWVVMPENISQAKKAAVAGYGAEIIWCEPSLEAREAALLEVVERTGAHFVHPFEDVRVIAGQGTVGLEIADQCGSEPPDVVIAPVGGGGLLAGLAVALAARLPDCEVIGAEPLGADDAHRSFHSGEWQPQLAAVTIADGLLTSLGQLDFELIRRHVDDVVTVEESGIIEAMRLVWTRMKQLIEPSAAVPIAAVLADRNRFAGRRVVVIASGGNVDLDALPWPLR